MTVLVQNTTPSPFEQLQDEEFRRSVVDLFHYLYYHENARTWSRTYWFGVGIQKCPLDLWVYQEILFEQQPDVIIECGTYHGGSALYLAHLLDLIGNGRIYTIDIREWAELPVHPRIEALRGSSTSPEVISRLRSLIKPNEKVLVILDSDHSEAHVREELEQYAPFVTDGSYLIVEDTNINGHPALPTFGPGPMEALDHFLERHPEFEIDTEREKFFLTFNPRGYLRRTGPPRSLDTDAAARFAASAVQVFTRDDAAVRDSEVVRYRYDADTDLPPDGLHSRAVRLVGNNKKVLELGCATGFVSRALAAEGNRVTGIDNDAPAARRAATHCERVLVADIEERDWERELGNETFDVVVATEVLEHLKDPVACLKRLRRFLTRDGYIIVTVPNVAHASVRLALLGGDFRYTDSGLLDRTHLRFFTRQTLERLFDESGYVIETLERNEAPFDNPQISFVEASLPEGVVDWLAGDEDAHTFNFLVKARPIGHGSDSALRRRIHSLLEEINGLREQIRLLNRPDLTRTGAAEGSETETAVHLRATILQLHRQLSRREAHLAEIQAQLDWWRDQAKHYRETTRSREDEVLALHEFINAKEDHLRSLSEFARTTTEEADRYVRSLQQHMASKDEELIALRLQLDSVRVSRDAACEALDRRVAEQQGEIERLRESMNAAETTATDLRTRLIETNRALETTYQQIRTKNEELVRAAEQVRALSGELSPLRDRCAKADEQLRSIHSSRLWRFGSVYWKLRQRFGLS